jgi:hypothetical protein
MNKVFAVAVGVNFGVHFESIDVLLDKLGAASMCENWRDI